MGSSLLARSLGDRAVKDEVGEVGSVEGEEGNGGGLLVELEVKGRWGERGDEREWEQFTDVEGGCEEGDREGEGTGWEVEVGEQGKGEGSGWEKERVAVAGSRSREQ